MEAILTDKNNTSAQNEKSSVQNFLDKENLKASVQSGVETIENRKSGSSWIPYLSYIRAVACFVIVILHTMNVSVILYGDSITAGEKTFSMTLVYASMWAVPVFIMVTGVLQLGSRTELTIKNLFTVLIWRMVKALILCCVVFRLFDMFMDGEAFTLGNILQAFSKLFMGQSWAHIWYLYMLIGLYLLMPFFRLITKNGSDMIIRYGLVVTIFFISILPLTKVFGIESAFAIPLTTIYPVYLFAGYAIHNDILKIRRVPAALITAAGLALIVILSVLKGGSYPDLPDIVIGSYASFAVVLLSFGVFALLKDIELKNVIGKILRSIDKCSFGIYLLHMIFIRLVLRYWQFNPYEKGFALTAFLIVAIFAVSYALVFVLRKLPVLKKII